MYRYEGYGRGPGSGQEARTHIGTHTLGQSDCADVFV